MFSDKNYYEILGVDPSASTSEIKSAYRKMSLKFHPDKNRNPDAQSIFQNLNMAYDILGDAGKKNEYDTQLKINKINKNSTNEFTNLATNDIFNMIFSDLRKTNHPLFFTTDNLGDFILRTGLRHNTPHQKPEQIQKPVQITIYQAYNGSKIPVEIERIIVHNEQKTTEIETIYVDIVPGVDTNESILIENMGHCIDGIHGDVRLIIKVDNDSCFVRSGLDLLYRKTISLKEALLGFSFNLQHLNGKIFKLNNTGKIIEPHFKTQLHNLGMFRDNQRGSLFIEFLIAFPESLTEEQITKLGDILD